MEKKTLEIIREIDEVITEIQPAMNRVLRTTGGNDSFSYRTRLAALHTKISALLDRYAPKDSAYYKNGNVYLSNFQGDIVSDYAVEMDLPPLKGVLVSLKDAYAKDYFTTINGLITVELFTDFLDMAEYFLSQGDLYKHPAAFLIGGVLEEHLRKLAVKFEIPIIKDNDRYRHAEDLNTDLRKKGVYSETERKSITAWLGLRNDVDHAHWEKYSSERVEIMLKDVKRIINQYPI